MHTQGADFFEQTYFLNRGDPNQKDGVATQGFLQVLMRTPDGEKRWHVAPPEGWRTSYRRRSLASWITDGSLPFFLAAAFAAFSITASEPRVIISSLPSASTLISTSRKRVK